MPYSGKQRPQIFRGVPVRVVWRDPKAVRLLLLAVSSALTVLVLGAAWTLAGGPSQPGPGSSSACAGTALTPASKVQAAINGAPSGTTFCFGRGIYRISSLIPKSGDVLNGGNRTAILDGGNSADYAIYGDSVSPGPSDVTVRGFVIQDFNTPLQRGAIEDFNGPGWIIQNNHITRNAAAGVATGDNVQVLDNLIDHNGQEGFSAHGDGGLYQGNEIAYNNYNLAINGDLGGWRRQSLGDEGPDLQVQLCA